MPPLRERRDEIPTLVESFIARYARKYKRPAPQLSRSCAQLFQTYDWPGNIRELENMIKRLVILQDEQIAFSEIDRNMQRVAKRRCRSRSPAPAPPHRRSALPPRRQLGRSAARQRAGWRRLPGRSRAADARRLAGVGGRAAAMKAERALIEQTLNQVHWNRRKASQISASATRRC